MRWICLTLVFVAAAVDAKPQRIAVKGIAMCDKKRLNGAKVELWERDPLSRDDLLNTDTTSLLGAFSVKGEQIELGRIEPYLVFTHTCNVKKPGCKRISEYPIPKSKLNDVYDMSFVNLGILAGKDREKC